MLEEGMSVSAAVPPSVPLSGAEGALVSVSVSVEPPRLEELLDALAHLEFPINPQIYHDAAVIYRYADDHEETEPATLVEFPAYENRLPEIRRLLESWRFPSDSLQATAMLDCMHSDAHLEAAPAGSPYRFRIRRKHAAALA